MRFQDRHDAGRQLGQALAEHQVRDAVVLGLARGGVPVAYEVAAALGAPLDVLVVRKVGAPGNPEYGVGAIAEDDVVLLDDAALARFGSSRDMEDVVNQERADLLRRVERYRGSRPPTSVAGRTAVIVDDGIATGGSAVAGVRTMRKRGADGVIVAAPVGAPSSVARLRDEADDVVCLMMPEAFFAVGSFYRDFGQTSDEEVVELLERAHDEPVVRREVVVGIGGVELAGYLWTPHTAHGLVVFAHGSGSSRDSARNQHVARTLNATGFATLLFDLLTEPEAADRRNVFDIALLAQRLVATIRWAHRRDDVGDLPVGLFGASTGAAAALTAAVELSDVVRAVVSRGGRPDLCEQLDAVAAPVLLIVGGEDHVVLDVNRDAARRLTAEHQIEVVKGATHLFQEPGTLDTAADRAGRWFATHL